VRPVAPFAALIRGHAGIHGGRHAHRVLRAARRMSIAFALAAGLVFGVGLIISGMTDPAKVIGFLDVAGRWDPSLAFVMGGAILVGFFALGLAGFCPGPALVSFASGVDQAAVFVLAMLGGMLAYGTAQRLR